MNSLKIVVANNGRVSQTLLMAFTCCVYEDMSQKRLWQQRLKQTSDSIVSEVM